MYASLLPVCACTVIPLLSTLKNKINLQTLLTFIIAAPLLSPYIIILSFSVLGWQYGIARIVASLILAISVAYIVTFFAKKQDIHNVKIGKTDCKTCHMGVPNIYAKTWLIMKEILPYFIIAAILGIVFELIQPYSLLLSNQYINTFGGMAIIVLIGIPIYFCNGAEILFLRPFFENTALSLGTSIAFSLTSTAICITSIVMLFKFLGKKITLILLASIFIICILLGYGINLVF